jgi:16S rRNA C1402 (ribose-2'-O) methylase RsmI
LEPPRGEITLVLGPGGQRAELVVAEDVLAAVAELIAGGVPRRRAVDLVARLTGAPRNALYRSSL